MPPRKKLSDFDGKIFKNNIGLSFKLIRYNTGRDVTVEFMESGTTKDTTMDSVYLGKVADRENGQTGRVKSLVCGWGINDVNQLTRDSEFYQKWKSMIDRVQNSEYYEDVSICNEWKKLSAFKEWMEEQDYYGRELDKDILSDEKIYSPSTCLFVLPRTNRVILESENSRNELSMGVHYDMQRNRFYSRVNTQEGYKFLGYTDTAREAEENYIVAKKAVLQDVFSNENKIVQDALKSYVRRKGYV